MFQKFEEIFASLVAPPVSTTSQVSTTPASNFATGTAGVVDTAIPVAYNGNNFRLLTP